MTRLQRYVEQYGPAAGPKLYHALQSRSAYIGANARRRSTIAVLTGVPTRSKRPSRPGSASTPLLSEPEAVAGDRAPATADDAQGRA